MEIEIQKDGRIVREKVDTNFMKTAIISLNPSMTPRQSTGLTVKDYLDTNITLEILNFIPFRRGEISLSMLGAIYNIESALIYDTRIRKPEDRYEGARVHIGPYRGGLVDVKTILSDREATPEEMAIYMKVLQRLNHS